MSLFSGKQGSMPSAAAGKVDVETQVRTMRSAGLTDSQIVSELKAQGAKETQVMSVLGTLNAQGPQPQYDPGYSGAGQSMQEQFAAPQAQAGMYPSQMNAMSTPMMGAAMQTQDVSAELFNRMEELVDASIDEKWDELIKEVRKIVEWKHSIEGSMQRMQVELDKLKEDFGVLHGAVIGKVEEYDKRMQEVGTELKAVGKVFKEVVPTFTENVKELRDISKRFKK